MPPPADASTLPAKGAAAGRARHLVRESRSMSAELIGKAVVAQFISEVFGELSDEHVHSLVTEDFRAHAWSSRTVADGTPHIEQVLSLLRSTFRNPRVRVLDLLAQGDRVAARYLFEADYVGEVWDEAARGRRIRLPGMLLARLRGERIEECWWEEDRLAMLAQLRAA
jgi:hypothetical protein